MSKQCPQSTCRLGSIWMNAFSPMACWILVDIKVLRLSQSLPMESDSYANVFFQNVDTYGYWFHFLTIEIMNFNELWTSGADSLNSCNSGRFGSGSSVSRDDCRDRGNGLKMAEENSDFMLKNASCKSFHLLGRHCSEGGLQAWSMSRGRGQMIAQDVSVMLNQQAKDSCRI